MLFRGFYIPFSFFVRKTIHIIEKEDNKMYEYLSFLWTLMAFMPVGFLVVMHIMDFIKYLKKRS